MVEAVKNAILLLHAIFMSQGDPMTDRSYQVISKNSKFFPRSPSHTVTWPGLCLMLFIFAVSLLAMVLVVAAKKLLRKT